MDVMPLIGIMKSMHICLKLQGINYDDITKRRIMIKKLICKLFGHVHVEEMYAAPLAYQEHRYVVIKECNCARCGKNISFKMSEPMSRVQMLQEGWFFQSEPICISRPYAKYKTGNWRIVR